MALIKRKKILEKKYSLKARMSSEFMLKTRIKNNNVVSESCSNITKAKNLKEFSFSINLEESFELYRDKVSRIYNYIYPEKSSEFSNLYNYHDQIQISKLLDNIDFPITFVHAENDPISIYKVVNKSLYTKLKNHNNVKLIITPIGGHASFLYVYSNDWLYHQVNLFIDNVF